VQSVPLWASGDDDTEDSFRVTAITTELNIVDLGHEGPVSERKGIHTFLLEG
jgi:hypothetical protein